MSRDPHLQMGRAKGNARAPRSREETSLSQMPQSPMPAELALSSLPAGLVDPRTPQKNTRKRKFGVTNPLDFPPSEYNKALFKCNHPFISITYQMPDDDKFKGLRMKEVTRNRALDHLLLPALRAFRSHDLKGEVCGRKFHSALFDNLGNLSMPSKVLINKVVELETDVEAFYPLPKKARVNVTDLLAKATLSAKNMENLDLIVSEGEKHQTPKEGQTSATFTPSNESEEETAPDAADAPGSGRTDIKLFVFNNSNQSLKEKFKTMDDVEPRKAVCICECKWEKEPQEDALMQAADYACQQALSNLGNLHFTAIYVMVLTRTHWTYAILDFRGCIKVVDGSIDADSLREFALYESVRFSRSPLSQHDLEFRLENRTRLFRGCYSEHPNAVYPDKSYLVGSLHVRNQWFRLPDFEIINGADGHDVRLFYEGLMRIIIGDKVDDWEVEDFNAIKDLRENLMEHSLHLVRAGCHVMAG